MIDRLPKPYYRDSGCTIYHADCREVLPALTPQPKFHAVLCDPPYALGLMGKAWDRFENKPRTVRGTGGTDAPFACHARPLNAGINRTYQAWTRQWASALIPLLYPGALVFCFGGTRTWHRLASGFEDAGFQMWDTFMWLHGQGFPKAQKIHLHKFHAYRTCALKPAWEPILCFKAPAQGKTYTQLARYYGTGCLNVDSVRIEGPMDGVWGTSNETCAPTFNASPGQHGFRSKPHTAGRYPANLLLDDEAAGMLDEQAGQTSITGRRSQRSRNAVVKATNWFVRNHRSREYPDESGGPSRFFYVAKASRRERAAASNNHPTIKPIALCKWLATLLLPPECVKQRRLLVPFSGSGSEIIGAMQARWDEIVGIEMDEGYCKIAQSRIRSWRSAHKAGKRPQL